MKKNLPAPTKNQKMLIARSPEAFPELRIFPEGWDLEHLSANSLRIKAKISKRKNKLDTFPDTTDAIL